MRLRGAPGKLALGFAVGACINFFPTFGLGIPVAGLAAGIVFANVPAGLLGDITFKPLFPVFFYFNFLTGSFFWTNPEQDSGIAWDGFLYPGAFNFGDFGRIFFTGALVNSIILGAIIYVTMFFLMEHYRPILLRRLTGGNRRNRICA